MFHKQSRANSYVSDCKGSVSMMFAIMSIALFAIVGLAVDSSRFLNLSGRLQDSLDAAALAGAKLLPDDTLSDSDIESLSEAHFESSVANTGVKFDKKNPLTVVIDRKNSSVQVTANVLVKSFFGRLAGQPTLFEVNRTSKVVYDLQKIELSMVLDITGSMNNNNKIGDMKAAAKDVMDALLDPAVNDKAVRIALAPYSASVNAGKLAASVSTTPPTSACSNNQQEGEDCKDSAGQQIDTCVIERTGANAATDAAPVGPDKLPTPPSLPYGKYSCPPSTVVPLLGKSKKDTLKSILDGYAAAGSTAGHIGTAWGWYLLSPAWASVLPPESAPEPYGTTGVTKSMIIMTDGLFNTSYLNGPSTADAAQMTESYAQFDALCNGIKAKGIQVYTVGFDLSDAGALAELQGCASAPSNFFDAKTGADLKKAFKAIAAKLNQLRVAS